MINNYDYQSQANIQCFLEDSEYGERKMALYKLFDKFNQENIHYGISCSFNLFIRGIVDEFHDFDLLVDSEDIPKIKEYITKKEWWDTIDCFDAIIGEIGLRDHHVDDFMLEWSMDEDFWLRRIAIDHQLSRKEQTKEDLLEQIIVNNLGSREFFINKAIGWSLREYSKTNPTWVKEFIDKYKDKLDKLSIREASKYI